MSVAKRIYAALAASTFGQIVTILTQVLLTPLFFSKWGGDKYGEWLLLSAVPAYLAMLDLGIGSAAGNSMGIHAANGRKDLVKVAFDSAALACAVAGIAVIGFSLCAGYALSVFNLKFALISLEDARFICLLLGLYVGLGFLNGLVLNGFRATEQNALAIFLANLARLMEAVFAALFLVGGAQPKEIALSNLFVRLVMLSAQLYVLRRCNEYLLRGRFEAQVSYIKQILAPAFGFLLLPLGQAMGIQGPLFVIGATLGAGEVAVFSALRTLTRIPVQLVNVLNHSVWPEVTRAFGKSDFALLRRLHRVAWGAAAWGFLIIGTGLYVTGSWIVSIWLKISLPASFDLLGALLLAGGFSALWAASQVVLSATNRHVRLTVYFIVVHAVGLACMYAWAKLNPSWAAIGVVVALSDFTLLAIAVVLANAICKDELRPFVLGALRFGPEKLWSLSKSFVSRVRR